MNETTGGTKTWTTDAFGRFAIRLANGDWSVNVSMPSGRVYEVSQIRSPGGRSSTARDVASPASRSPAERTVLHQGGGRHHVAGLRPSTGPG